MKSAQVVKTIKEETDLLEKTDLVRCRGMLILPPLSPIVSIIGFDSSGWDKEMFYASAFIYPLFSDSTIFFNSLGSRIGDFGKRLPPSFYLHSNNGDDIRVLVNLIKKKALPWLKSVRTVKEVLANFEADKTGILGVDKYERVRTSHHYEIMGLCAVWLGDKKKAKKYFTLMLREMNNPYADWHHETIKKAKAYLLELDDMSKFREKLEGRIKQNYESLKFPKKLWHEGILESP